jgi:hypothetical protein
MIPLWDPIVHLSDPSPNRENLLLQKVLVKWWTRMSCMLLPPRIVSWPYQRGKRSLLEEALDLTSATIPTSTTIKVFQSDPLMIRDDFYPVTGI